MADADGLVDAAGSKARAGEGVIPPAFSGYLIACWMSIMGVVELSSSWSSTSSGQGSREDSLGARVLSKRPLDSKGEGMVLGAVQATGVE